MSADYTEPSDSTDDDRHVLQITQLTHGPKAWAAHYALSEILSRVSGAAGSRLPKTQAILRLVQHRRARLGDMTAEGWRPIGCDEKRMAFIYGCPPTSVVHSWKNRRHCTMPTFCPFCWIRSYTYPLFDRLLSLLFYDWTEVVSTAHYLGHDKIRKRKGRPDKPPVELAELHVTHQFHRDYWALTDLWHFVNRYKDNARKKAFKGQMGGYSLCSIVPDGDDGWILRQRSIAIMPPQPRHYRYAEKPAETLGKGHKCRTKIRRVTFTADDEDATAKDAAERYARESRHRELLRDGFLLPATEQQAGDYNPMTSLAAAVGRVTMVDARSLYSPSSLLREILDDRVPPAGYPGIRYRAAEFYGMLRRSQFEGTHENWQNELAARGIRALRSGDSATHNATPTPGDEEDVSDQDDEGGDPAA